MKIFLAIPISKEIAEKLGEFQKGLPLENCGRRVPQRNFHVTIFFLGEISGRQFKKLRSELREIVEGIESFELPFARVEYRPPKMIWARFCLTREWENFWNSVAEVAGKFSEKIGRNKQIPHITIARLKFIPQTKLLRLKLPKFAVQKIEIWQSRLGSTGAEYCSLASFPLEKTFTEKVLKIVSQISEGEVQSYREVAAAAGNSKAARAVGSILTKNFDPKIPCHRIVCSNGKIGNWNRGQIQKIRKLKREGVKIFHDEVA